MEIECAPRWVVAARPVAAVESSEEKMTGFGVQRPLAMTGGRALLDL